MHPAGFETTIAASDRPQTHALDRAASETGVILTYFLTYIPRTYIHTYILSYLLTYILTYLLTHSLTHSLTHGQVLLENLTGFQLLKKFPTS